MTEQENYSERKTQAHHRDARGGHEIVTSRPWGLEESQDGTWRRGGGNAWKDVHNPEKERLNLVP